MYSNQVVATYDPRKVSLVINGRIITGFAEGEMISIARNEDNVLPYVGTQGDVARAINANWTGIVTVHLMSTSNSLRMIRELSQTSQFITLTISDVNDDRKYLNEDQCWFVKAPDVPLGKQVVPVSVQIYVPFLDIR
jgi:hypothetical protein